MIFIFKFFKKKDKRYLYFMNKEDVVENIVKLIESMGVWCFNRVILKFCCVSCEMIICSNF